MAKPHDLFLRRNGTERAGHCRVSRLGIRRVVEAVADRRLRPVDLQVLLVILQGTGLSTGSIQASVRELAATTRLSSAVIQESLRRLQVEGLMRRAGMRRHSPHPRLAVNPELVITGNPTFAEKHLRFWRSVENLIPPLPAPPSAIRAGLADPPAAPADDDQAA